MFLKKGIRYLKDKEFRFNVNKMMGLYNGLSDEEFLQKFFKAKYGRKIDLKNPRTFNEKMQWLKLHDRNPLYIQMVDKYLVREYIARVIGSEHLIPLLGVWENADEIDFHKLPEQFVLKCNHNSGKGSCICRDKRALNEKKVKRELREGLREDYYLTGGREWPYKEVPRKIIAEKYLEDDSNGGLKDYKFFTFSGQVHYIEVIYDRNITPQCSFYTREWEYVPFSTMYPTDASHQIERPGCLERMIEIAETLAGSIGNPAFLRVDLYCCDKKVYFGEFTFYHNSGGGRFQPEVYDGILGDFIKL